MWAFRSSFRAQTFAMTPSYLPKPTSKPRPKPSSAPIKGDSRQDWENSTDWRSDWSSDWITQCTNLHRKKAEDETGTTDLTWPETSCHKVNNDDGNGYASIPEDEEDDHEAMIKRSRAVLQRHSSKTLFDRPAPSKRKRRQSGKGFSKHPKRNSKPDDKGQRCKVEVGELRYSQLSCKENFQCGRPVLDLIKDLWYGRVKLSEPFLQLTVFETIDEQTDELILRCIDNRRLYALKEYAKLCDDPVMVNVNLFSYDTLTQVQRFIQNSDETDGRRVRVRGRRSNTQHQR